MEHRVITELEDAWVAVHEALPAGWTVGPTSHTPRSASGPGTSSPSTSAAERCGRWTEAEALRDLAALLGGWHVEDAEAKFY